MYNLLTEKRENVKFILRTIDNWLLLNKLHLCDDLLESVKLENLDDESILAIATYTNCARSELKSYNLFIFNARKHFESKMSKSEVNNLLYGLE